ncbi:MAG: hypothetical protein R2749_12795 [Acidimicrobiales bacterium]
MTLALELSGALRVREEFLYTLAPDEAPRVPAHRAGQGAPDDEHRSTRSRRFNSATADGVGSIQIPGRTICHRHHQRPAGHPHR